MTTICLVRHGETDWNRCRRLQGREDVELNAQGRAQATRTAQYLARYHWDLVVTSPLRRAAETAQIIAAALGDAPVVQMPALVERDYGAASGLTPEQRRERFPHDDVPGMEERAAVSARGMAALHQLAADHPSWRILVVAHGGIINAMLSAISGGEIGTGKTFLHNGCLSVIHFRSDSWEIESHNTTTHLDRPIAS